MLAWLAAAVCRHPRWFVYPQLALVLASVAVTVAFLQFDMDQDDLVGPNLTDHQNFLAVQKEFPQQGNDLAVVVESEDIEKNRQFVERLAVKMAPETNLFQDIFFQHDLAMMGTKALFFVPTNDLATIQTTLHDDLPFIKQFMRTTNLVTFFEQINTAFRPRRARRTADRIAGPISAGVDAHPDAGQRRPANARLAAVAGRRLAVRRGRRVRHLHHPQSGPDFSAYDARAG